MSGLGGRGGDMTHLYRHFDEIGRLLYVGISLSALNRLAQHKDHSHWFSKITTVKIEKYDTREQALAAEREAIANEHPKCNINHREYQPTPAERRKQAEESRQALLRRIVHFNVTYTSLEIAKELGIPHQKVLSDMELGKLGYFEFFARKSGRWEPKLKRRITGWQFIDYIEYIQGERVND